MIDRLRLFPTWFEIFIAINSLSSDGRYIKPFKFDSDGQSAKSIETGRMRKTTGIIIEISAFPAAAII